MEISVGFASRNFTHFNATLVVFISNFTATYAITSTNTIQTGMSIAFKSSGILKVLYKVQPPVTRSVAAIPLDAVTNAILPSDLILARIRLNRKVLPVPPGTSKNSIPL